MQCLLVFDSTCPAYKFSTSLHFSLVPVLDNPTLVESLGHFIYRVFGTHVGHI
jgi:hypothetical protein